MVRLSPASSLFPYTTLFRSLSPPRTPADPFSVGSHGKTYRSALVEWITLTPDNLRWTSKHAAHLGQRLAVEIQARHQNPRVRSQQDRRDWREHRNGAQRYPRYHQRIRRAHRRRILPGL